MGKQFYHYDVARWLDGDPGQPPPPARRATGGNARWRHLTTFDVISMPDPWEYPWFAAWDLAFHCVALAHVDPAFAKYQLLLLCREWFQHPNGAAPGLRVGVRRRQPAGARLGGAAVFEHRRRRDHDFLDRVFPKLLLNFTWWVNRKDPDGNNLFEGGFLGLDNIGPFDRSHLPPAAARAGRRHRLDGVLRLDMLEIAAELAEEDHATDRHRRQVLRALRADRRRHATGAVGRGGRLLLRPSSPGRRARSVPSRSARWSAFCRCWARSWCPRRSSTGDCPGTGAHARAPGHRPVHLVAGVVSASPAAASSSASSAASASRACSSGCSTRASSCPRTGCAPCPSTTRAPPTSTSTARRRHGRLRAGRVDHRHVRRQLQLARAGLVPGQLPRIEALAALRPRWATTSGRVPHGVRAAPLTEVADDLRRRLISLFLPARTGGGPVRLGRSAAGRPGLDRHMLFNEYFHGDNGAGLGATTRPGGRAGRRPDLPPARAEGELTA